MQGAAVAALTTTDGSFGSDKAAQEDSPRHFHSEGSAGVAALANQSLRGAARAQLARAMVETQSVRNRSGSLSWRPWEPGAWRKSRPLLSHFTELLKRWSAWKTQAVPVSAGDCQCSPCQFLCARLIETQLEESRRWRWRPKSAPAAAASLCSAAEMQIRTHHFREWLLCANCNTAPD